MKHKKGFVARDFVLAFLVASTIIALYTVGAYSMADRYGKTDIIDADFADKFDNFNNNTAKIQSMFNATASENGLSLYGTFDVLFKSTFTVISLVFESMLEAVNQITSLGEYIGIPPEVASIILVYLAASLTVIIVFIVISSVSRRDL